ncbi:26S proteasome subunit RPN7-domain-containing protein [Melampsora americana]|nr:26S proteasome subunit RPN7-domain-containing protein [Melampsora americana]
MSTSITTNASSDQSIPLPYPNLLQQDQWFILNQINSKHLHQKTFDELIENIKKDEMGPFLKTILEEYSNQIPSDLISKIPKDLINQTKRINTEKLQQLDQKIKDSIKNLGETEISDSLRSKAFYLSQIGSKKEDFIKALEMALEKRVGSDSKIDLRLALIRIGFFYLDHSLITQEFSKTKALVDSGGDWD